MSAPAVSLTGVERTFDSGEIIVSKTDLKGRITYANDLFLTLADYSEREILGQPHNIIRHPQMPRSIFKLLWEHIRSGREIFAYVMNRSRNGDHYWVIAHVTPSRDTSGQIVGYHSNRRAPKRTALTETIIPLYRTLRAMELEARDPKQGLETSGKHLKGLLDQRGMETNEYFLSL